MEEQRIHLANGDGLIRTKEGVYFVSINDTSLPIVIDREEGESLVFETAKQLKAVVESLLEEKQQLIKFYSYFSELYGQGLEIANWHKNGDLEAFDNFFDSAEQEME